MKTLLHPTYFPDVVSFATLVQNEIQWEIADNFQKQTYRNRCYICTDRGKHSLNIPIQHIGAIKGRRKYKDVRIENEYPWQREHWRTLETAYRSSPFFEFYEDDIVPLYEKKHNFLMDFNLKTIEIICNFIDVPMPTQKTEIYAPIADGIDARILVNAKKQDIEQQAEYTQVFDDRHGFIPNTSILDVLFNQGTTTLAYLKKITLNSLNA